MLYEFSSTKSIIKDCDIMHIVNGNLFPKRIFLVPDKFLDEEVEDIRLKLATNIFSDHAKLQKIISSKAAL